MRHLRLLHQLLIDTFYLYILVAWKIFSLAKYETSGAPPHAKPMALCLGGCDGGGSILALSLSAEEDGFARVRSATLVREISVLKHA